MPFKSKAQMRYLFSQKPEVAKEFETAQKAEGKSFKNMPEHVEKFKRLKKHMGKK